MFFTAKVFYHTVDSISQVKYLYIKFSTDHLISISSCLQSTVLHYIATSAFHLHFSMVKFITCYLDIHHVLCLSLYDNLLSFLFSYRHIPD